MSNFAYAVVVSYQTPSLLSWMIDRPWRVRLVNKRICWNEREKKGEAYVLGVLGSVFDGEYVMGGRATVGGLRCGERCV
jgi:hypothetical protein